MRTITGCASALCPGARLREPPQPDPREDVAVVSQLGFARSMQPDPAP